jgi:hypothetical protein
MATVTADESSAESTWIPDPTTPESRSLRGNSLDDSTPEETTTESQARTTSQDSPLFPSPGIDPRLLHIPDLADVPMPEPSPNSGFDSGDTLGFDSIWPQGNLSPAETASNDTNSPSVNSQPYSSPHHQFDQFGMPAPHDNNLPFPQVCTPIVLSCETQQLTLAKVHECFDPNLNHPIPEPMPTKPKEEIDIMYFSKIFRMLRQAKDLQRDAEGLNILKD